MLSRFRAVSTRLRSTSDRRDSTRSREILNDPGKPWQNGADESFNGKFRDECLSVEWFRSRREAVAVIETWRQHYNEVRPHSSLGYRTPAEFKQHNQLPQPAVF